MHDETTACCWRRTQSLPIAEEPDTSRWSHSREWGRAHNLRSGQRRAATPRTPRMNCSARLRPCYTALAYTAAPSSYSVSSSYRDGSVRHVPRHGREWRRAALPALHGPSGRSVRVCADGWNAPSYGTEQCCRCRDRRQRYRRRYTHARSGPVLAEGRRYRDHESRSTGELLPTLRERAAKKTLIPSPVGGLRCRSRQPSRAKYGRGSASSLD